MAANPTLDIILRRRSVRSYRPDPIRAQDLQAILLAGQYAPHAGDQQWHFTAVCNRQLLARLNDAAKEAARTSEIPWLRELGCNEEFDCLYGAPMLVIVSYDTASPIPLDADCYAAAENMLLAAESLDLGSCWVYFVLPAFSSALGEQLRVELRIPEGYNPCVAAVMGHKAGESSAAPPRKGGCVTILE